MHTGGITNEVKKMSMCSKFLFLVFKKFTSVAVLPTTMFARHVHA